MLIARDKTQSIQFPFTGYDYTHASFDLLNDISPAFWDFVLPLHDKFTSRQQVLSAKRTKILAGACAEALYRDTLSRQWQRQPHGGSGFQNGVGIRGIK